MTVTGDAVELAVLLGALICVIWTRAGRWRKVSVPFFVRLVDAIAFVGFLIWMMWVLAQRGL